MSRAFVNEDNEGAAPRYSLPAPDDPTYPMAAARALLAGANAGDTGSAEAATGYLWGDPRLVDEFRQLRLEAIERNDDRAETLTERYLRTAGITIED